MYVYACVGIVYVYVHVQANAYVRKCACVYACMGLVYVYVHV